MTIVFQYAALAIKRSSDLSNDGDFVVRDAFYLAGVTERSTMSEVLGSPIYG